MKEIAKTLNWRIITILILICILHSILLSGIDFSRCDWQHLLFNITTMTIVGIILSFFIYRRNDAQSQNDILSKEIRLTQRLSIETLGTIAEYKDRDTAHHLKRIRKYVYLLVKQLVSNSKYSIYLQNKKDYVEDITLASLLHDIGKIAIPKGILTKPGKLTDKEYETMKKHTTIASDMLEKASFNFIKAMGKKSYLDIAQSIALCHHERWDGKGYPCKISGESIPLSARIVSVADTYDAMRSVRTYADAVPHDVVVEEILKESKKQFDPEVVKAFLIVEKDFELVSKSV